MFRALIGFFFSLLGFLQQFDQIMRGVLRFGSFGNHVVTLQWITLRFPGRNIDVPGKAFCCDIMVENEDAGRHLYRGLIFGKNAFYPMFTTWVFLGLKILLTILSVIVLLPGKRTSMALIIF